MCRIRWQMWLCVNEEHRVGVQSLKQIWEVGIRARTEKDTVRPDAVGITENSPVRVTNVFRPQMKTVTFLQLIRCWVD